MSALNINTRFYWYANASATKINLMVKPLSVCVRVFALIIKLYFLKFVFVFIFYAWYSTFRINIAAIYFLIANYLKFKLFLFPFLLTIIIIICVSLYKAHFECVFFLRLSNSKSFYVTTLSLVYSSPARPLSNVPNIYFNTVIVIVIRDGARVNYIK